MTRLKTLVFFAFLVCANGFAQTTKQLILQPDSTDGKDAVISWIADTTLSFGNRQETNFANAKNLSAYEWTWSGIKIRNRSVFQFDLGKLPAGSQIVDAKLSLYSDSLNQHSTLSGSNAVYLRRLLNDWDEETVTYNNCPEATIVNQVSILATTQAFQNILDIDVTRLVMDMQRNGNYGFLMQLATEVKYRNMAFCSSDNKNPEKRPKLVIFYEEPTIVTVYDTVRVTVYDITHVEVYDTTHTEVYDTTHIVVHDTIFTNVCDTNRIVLYDTISVTDTLIIDVTFTAVDDVEIAELSVYPNPTSQNLYVDISNDHLLHQYSISIVNILGKEVFFTNITQNHYSIRFDDFGEPGLYFFRLINNKGVVVENKKIILK